MKPFLAQHKLLAFIAVVVLFAGCKQPETIIVDQDPTAAAASDTTVQDEISSNEASFRKLVIGEYNPVPSMDPLMADNPSAMRAVQLVYEGLTRLDANGSVVPGLAESWEVTNDSLTYTFDLRNNIYFQDNDAFSTGMGRKMTPGDVKFVFERMAKTGVPPTAAQLFMGIEGFDPYYHEQHDVYLPANRTLDGISGIQTPTDSTVVFKLTGPDPQFLKKLATPLAVIYPQEAVGRLTDFSPVGTGPFQFSSRTSDSTIVFSKFQNYYNASQIHLDRVDLVSSSESKLFQAMSKDEVFLLPEMGPQTLPVLLKGDGTLQSSYANRYNVKTGSGFTEYALRYYPQSNLSAQNARAIASLAKTNTTYFDQFPDGLVTPQNSTGTTTTSSGLSLSGKVSTVFSANPYVTTYLGNLAKILDQDGVTLQMMNIQTPTRNTSLFFTEHYPIFSNSKWDDYDPLFKFRVSHLALLRNEISGLDTNQYPWWFDLRGVKIPALENLN